jgi:membrane-bound lytic murein transglycosylase B
MKLIKFLIIFLIFSFKFSYAYDANDFNNWKLDFKKIALKNNISENTFKPCYVKCSISSKSN